MSNENPYISLFADSTDDEILEILENPSKTSSSKVYEAVIEVAIKRELITDYQASNLMEGNTSVLKYDPDILEKEPEIITKRESSSKVIFKIRKNGLKTGLIFMLAGLAIVVLEYNRTTIVLEGYTLYFPGRLYGGIFSLIFGFILFIIGFFYKIRKRKTSIRSDEQNRSDNESQ